MASSGAIAGWFASDSYKLLRGCIIAAAQLLDVLKDVFPFAKLHRQAVSLTVALELLLIDAEDEWEQIHNWQDRQRLDHRAAHTAAEVAVGGRAAAHPGWVRAGWEDRGACHRGSANLLSGDPQSGGEAVTDRETSRQLARELGLENSIFPWFDIGVPMPEDTAVPGSYGKSVPVSRVEDLIGIARGANTEYYRDRNDRF